MQAAINSTIHELQSLVIISCSLHNNGFSGHCRSLNCYRRYLAVRDEPAKVNYLIWLLGDYGQLRIMLICELKWGMQIWTLDTPTGGFIIPSTFLQFRYHYKNGCGILTGWPIILRTKTSMRRPATKLLQCCRKFHVASGWGRSGLAYRSYTERDSIKYRHFDDLR